MHQSDFYKKRKRTRRIVENVVLYLGIKHAEVVERQTRCLQAAVGAIP